MALREYVAILKANRELQRLMVAGAGCKLAFSIATNMTVHTSQKHGQKASLIKYTKLALVMYIGVLVLLCMWVFLGG